MKSLGYSGTVAGYRRFARRHVLRAAFRGLTVVEAAKSLQSHLDTARRQDKVCRALRGGSVA